MMILTRRSALAPPWSTVGLAGGDAPAGAFAQGNYPDKPIRMIIAFAAGGPTDIVGRMLAPQAS